MSAICKNCKAVKENKEDYCSFCGHKETVEEQPEPAVVERQAKNIFCSNCGEEIDVKNNFCSNCGVFFRKKALPKLSEDYLNGGNGDAAGTDFEGAEPKPNRGTREDIANIGEEREEYRSAESDDLAEEPSPQTEEESIASVEPPQTEEIKTPVAQIDEPPQIAATPPIAAAVVPPPVAAAAPELPAAPAPDEKHLKLKDKICKFGLKLSVLMIFTVLLPLFRQPSGELVLGIDGFKFTLGYVYLISVLLIAFCSVISLFHIIKRGSSFLKYFSLLLSFASVGLLIGFGYGNDLMYGYYIGLAAATYFLAAQSLYFVMTVKKK
jgi:RNA polymerase subunit RPABC4/transcription elongation factor Spt4